jgi:hypothetical protein
MLSYKPNQKVNLLMRQAVEPAGLFKCMPETFLFQSPFKTVIPSQQLQHKKACLAGGARQLWTVAKY